MIAAMILEHALLSVATGREEEFERAFVTATPIITSMPHFYDPFPEVEHFAPVSLESDI